MAELVQPASIRCPTCNLFRKAAQFHHQGSTQCIVCDANKATAEHEQRLAKRRAEKANTAERKRRHKAETAARRTAAKTRRNAEREKAKQEVAKANAAKREVRRYSAKLNIAERELAARELAKRNLLPFIVRHKPDYIPGWVHKDICTRLEKFAEDVEAGKAPRLMLQMPPRHGKSEIASVNFPAWYLGRNPKHEIISATYAGSLALGFSRKVRALLRDDLYKTAFKTRLDPDNQNAEGWMTSKGGGYIPAGVGGPITGKGAHILIIDDPIKNAEEAESETSRASIKAWYQTTAYTRLAPGGGVLIIQTRWHDDDLSGWLEALGEKDEGDKWDIVCYPAEAIKNEKYRRKGEALHEARYPHEALMRIKKAVGPRTWQALYQQDPASEDGDYFKRDMFQWYTGDPPKRLTKYAAWDLAIGKGDRNDYTVGAVVGIDDDDNMWLLDIRRGRWDSFEIVEQMLDVYRTWGPETTGIEKGQLSMAIGPYLEQRITEERLYGMHVKDLPPGRRDKESRARAIQGRMKQGKVRFPKEAPWLDTLLHEMLRFPNGVHDDIVDALAWVGLMLQEMAPPNPEARLDPDADAKWKKKLRKFITGGNDRRKSAMTA
jgi:predicted phage terminase large subunit-like protein